MIINDDVRCVTITIHFKGKELRVLANKRIYIASISKSRKEREREREREGRDLGCKLREKMGLLTYRCSSHSILSIRIYYLNSLEMVIETVHFFWLCPQTIIAHIYICMWVNVFRSNECFWSWFLLEWNLSFVLFFLLFIMLNNFNFKYVVYLILSK
jgi:hypothetical protein